MISNETLQREETCGAFGCCRDQWRLVSSLINPTGAGSICFALIGVQSR